MDNAQEVSNCTTWHFYSIQIGEIIWAEHVAGKMKQINISIGCEMLL
jgi:hypothetical protein